MHTFRRIKLFELFIVWGLILNMGCAPRVIRGNPPPAGNGLYDSEFPNRDASGELEAISRTIRKINSTSYYKSFVFDEARQLRKSELPTLSLLEAAVSNHFSNTSTYGTATIIYSSADKIALLTCAHIILAPDTIITYFVKQDGKTVGVIQTVSIRVKQQYYISDMPDGNDLQILATDREKDIAVLGKSFFKPADVPVFKLPLGDSAALDWGSFVYLLGFPMGNKMVTRGIVSKSDADDPNEFLVDALFNRGSSGGVILAVRDGIPNLELVGLTKAVSSQTRYLLSPSDSLQEDLFNSRLPYKNEAYILEHNSINYGITFTVSAASLRRFFKINDRAFKRMGYDFSTFFR